jgi:DNA processing protein
MDLLSVVAISTLPGIARPRAAAVFKALREASPDDASLEHVIAACAPSAAIDAVAAEARREAAILLDRAGAACIEAIRWDGEKYPPLLREIVDPPPVLWVRGCADILTRQAVAIVGSRAATSYALEVAGRLAGELADRGLVVVSGLARGADGAAHRGCLAAGGATVAVLGSGPDVIYPPEHAALAASICQDGAVVSELGPGAPPLPEHFPLRNRLISGISLAVVVVEASERSGSLITARCALEQGRDVMAVPGSVLGGRNRGSHALLKDGAKVVETADDILEDLGWPAARPTKKQAGKGEESVAVDPQISRNSLCQDDLLQKLTPGDSYDVDEMSATVGLTGSLLLPRLTEWEMQGRLMKIGAGRYVVAPRK